MKLLLKYLWDWHRKGVSNCCWGNLEELWRSGGVAMEGNGGIVCQMILKIGSPRAMHDLSKHT